MWHNSKTKNVTSQKTKLWLNPTCQKTQKLKFWQDSKIRIVTKLKLGQSSKTYIETKRKNSNSDKTQKLKLWQRKNSKGLELLRNNWAKPMKKCLPPICFQKNNALWRISNNILNFVTFIKSKMTSPFDWNKAIRLINLNKVWQD